MKRLISTLLMSFLMLGELCACTSSPSAPAPDEKKSDKVEILYFHGKGRCATCVAIEKVARELYEQEYKTNPKVEFRVVDMSTDEGAALAQKHKIAYSSLVVGGVNLTDEAYRYARSQPEELKSAIRRTIEKCLK